MAYQIGLSWNMKYVESRKERITTRLLAVFIIWIVSVIETYPAATFFLERNKGFSTVQKDVKVKQTEPQPIMEVVKVAIATTHRILINSPATREHSYVYFNRLLPWFEVDAEVLQMIHKANRDSYQVTLLTLNSKRTTISDIMKIAITYSEGLAADINLL